MSNRLPLGLYLHIPWCPTRCIYCDFNTYVDGEDSLKQRYQAALRREIQETGQALSRPKLDTIFFGGGTPTTLNATEFAELIEMVKLAFDVQPHAEITTEANPGTLSFDYLQEIRQMGINRLSLGVQSFADDELRFLSRLHDANTARRAVHNARRAGFDNLSLDLIFNLPDQTLSQWQFTLHEAVKLDPDHLSIYALIVEPGTPLHRQVDLGQVPLPDDDVAADMYELTIETLGQVGYTHYEISNWARSARDLSWQTPPLAAAHNLIYWRNQPYLGLGAGAFGTFHGERWMNVKRPQSYIQRVETGQGLGLARDEKSYERIVRETAMAEQMLLGLRLVEEGVSLSEFQARFQRSLEDYYAEAIAFGLDRKLLEWGQTETDPRLRLTRQGRFLANQVMVKFMA